MKKQSLTVFALSLAVFVLYLSGCSSPTCRDYAEVFDSCRDTVLSNYSQPLKVEGKGTVTCQKDTAIKDCGVGNYCVKPPQRAFAICYTGGTIYSRFRSLGDTFISLCDPIFAARQAKGGGYYQCIKDAKCDVKKIAECKKMLRKDKPVPQNKVWMSFFIFFALTLVIEGLLLFFAIKLVDPHNPKNNLFRTLALAAFMGIISYPLVYYSPLIGIIVTSSIFFGLIIAVFHQEMALTGLFTALHVVWAWLFFNYTVANGQLGNKVWLYQSTKMRVAIEEKHTRLQEELDEYLKKQEKFKKKKEKSKKKEDKSDKKEK